MPEKTPTPDAAGEIEATGTAGLENKARVEPAATDTGEAGPEPQNPQAGDPGDETTAAGTTDGEPGADAAEEPEQPKGSPGSPEPAPAITAEVADTEEATAAQPVASVAETPPPPDELKPAESPEEAGTRPTEQGAAGYEPLSTETAPGEQAASADDAPVPGRGDPAPDSPIPAGDTLVLPAPTETRKAPDPPESAASRDLRRIMSWSPRWRRRVVAAATVVGLVVLGALLAEFAPLGPLAPGRAGSGGTTPTISLGTSTTVPSPTSTLDREPVPFIDPLGEPIAIAELRLGLEGIGPIAIGSDGREAVGRLVSTLGQPDADTGVTDQATSWGACDGEEIRVVRWGSLVVINTVSRRGNETFAAYRLDLVYHQGAHPADELLTLSGLSPGDTVADLQATYEGFEVTLLDRWFELRSNSDGQLLLHGPLTSSDSAGVVRGIYSPDICESG